jgi:hypothetical protein
MAANQPACELCLSYLFGESAENTRFCPDCVGDSEIGRRVIELECQLVDVILMKEPRIAPGHA